MLDFLRTIREIYLNKGANYLTLWYRPRDIEDIDNYTEDIASNNVGIVIQGNLKYDDDFTYNTVKLYRHYYPQATIIVSCWNTDLIETIDRIRELGAKVVISEFPTVRKGFGPNNLQLMTTKHGIDYAEKLGCNYILKTRSDQRLYQPCVFTFFKKLLLQYPLKLNIPNSGRIITCSLSTFTNRLYNISDMLLFGRIEDIKRYFSCPVDNRDPSEEYKEKNQIEYSKQRCGEIYFASHYIESMGFNLRWTKEDSDYYRKELFIVVDSESIDQYWPKYTNREYRWRRYKKDVLSQSSFMEWLTLQD